MFKIDTTHPVSGAEFTTLDGAVKMCQMWGIRVDNIVNADTGERPFQDGVIIPRQTVNA
jgi:hypothetical protein